MSRREFLAASSLRKLLIAGALIFPLGAETSTFSQFVTPTGSSQTFTASGTWTRPAGVTQVSLLAVGGGVARGEAGAHVL